MTDDLDALASAAGNGPAQPHQFQQPHGWYGSEGYAQQGHAPAAPRPPPAQAPTLPSWTSGEAFMWGFWAAFGALAAWALIAGALIALVLLVRAARGE
jgi:hypothetical protein